MVAWMLPERFREWTSQLAESFDSRSRKYWIPVLFGIIFAQGRRTASSWFRAAGVSDDWQDYYYFLGTVGRKVSSISTEFLRLAARWIPAKHIGEYIRLAIDDSPTKRYGPKVEGAGIHHNPTPGPSGSKLLYGHVWVTISWLVRHPHWGTIGLALRAKMYVRCKDLMKLRQSKKTDWPFQTKLVLAVQLAKWAASWLQFMLEKPVIVVADGAYAKRQFLKPLIADGITIVSRLRKDAALCSLPKHPAKPGRGRKRIYGENKLHLARRASHPQGWSTDEFKLYGESRTVRYKTFVATYRPAGGKIRVVIVRDDSATGWTAFFATDSDLSVQVILECVADRSAIEQNFHDVKEVEGAGQQQLRNLFTNLAAWNLCLWVHTLVELWSWKRGGRRLKQRSDRPWDDAQRRPSHMDRLKSLRRQILQETFSPRQLGKRATRKIRNAIVELVRLAA